MGFLQEPDNEPSGYILLIQLYLISITLLIILYYN